MNYTREVRPRAYRPADGSHREHGGGRRGSHGVTVDRLTFVYAASGTLAGELAYLYRSRVKGHHCSLCDITHGWTGKRREFRACAARLDVPITYRHTNDLEPEYRVLLDALPTVIAHEGTRWWVALDPSQIEECGRDVERFERALVAALDAGPPDAGPPDASAPDGA